MLTRGTKLTAMLVTAVAVVAGIVLRSPLSAATGEEDTKGGGGGRVVAASGIPSVEATKRIADSSTRIGAAQRRHEAPAYSVTGNAGSMHEFVDIVVREVNDYWADRFAAGGAPYVAPSYVVVEEGEIAYSACTDESGQNAPATAHESAFYCAAGGQFGDTWIDTPVMYLPTPWLYETFSPVNPANFDFAVASVVAHEFGHHVQYILLRSGTVAPEAMPGKWKELSADCLGGTWANAVYYKGQLQDTDVEEAMVAAYNGGSDLPLPEGYPGDHGTKDERAAAFKFGYDTGNAMSCFG